ncbi:hypothetical protein ACFC25_16820 [Pseudarthrobacter sp. NPDC055928]
MYEGRYAGIIEGWHKAARDVLPSDFSEAPELGNVLEELVDQDS